MENKDNANKKNTANDRVYKGEGNNKTMTSIAKEIVYNGKIVSVHGNEYDFGNPIKINGEIMKHCYVKPDNLTWSGKFFGFAFRKKSSHIPSNVEIKFSNSNNKDYPFRDPFKLDLYEDFLLKRVALNGKSDKPLEDISLWKLKNNGHAWMYNYYNFDKNNHISGVKQAVTLTFVIQKDSPFSLEGLKDIKNMSPREKLLVIINNIAKKNNAYDYQLAFDGNNAYALIKDKLYFFDDTKVFIDEEKKVVKYAGDKHNMFIIDNNAIRASFLTTFKGKVFVASDSFAGTGAKILVFNKDRKLESKINLSGDFSRDDLRKYLSRLNPRTLAPRLDEEQFDIERKRYFDKCVQKKADKKKEEELNKKNNESKKEDKKEDKKDNKNKNNDKNKIIEIDDDNEVSEDKERKDKKNKNDKKKEEKKDKKNAEIKGTVDKNLKTFSHNKRTRGDMNG